MPKQERSVRLVFCLYRTAENAEATIGFLHQECRPDLEEEAPAPVAVIEKPWCGNAANLSRLAPKAKYRLVRDEEDNIAIVNVNLTPVKGREEEQLFILPARSLADVPDGSIGVVAKHTSHGKGYAPLVAFEPLRERIFAALDRKEVVILTVRP